MELRAAPTARGVRAAPPDSLLVDRARDLLAAGPAEEMELVSQICQLPGAPRLVAEHLARTLFGGLPEFRRLDDGRWMLDASMPAAVALAALGGSAVPCRLLDESFVVVDVETTGGRPHAGDRITEIAAVVVERGSIGEVYETLVNPERPIPSFITALTNISWSMVRDAPRFSDICDDVVARLDSRVFVAHNAPFDWRFVGAEVARASGRRLDGRRLCTVRLARKLLPQLSRRSLDVVARYYGVAIGARHRAAGDAVATAEVLLRLLGDAADRDCNSWEALDQLFAPVATKRRRRRSAMPGPSAGGEGA